MITTTNMVAKMAAVVAGLGLVFVAFAPAASAQTTTTTTTTTSASVMFTRDLTLGSSGADVTALQTWLIAKGHSIPAGATGYFGAQTQAALAAYQAANGISPAAGYFGPITRAHVNANAGGNTGGNDDDDDDDDNDDDDNDDDDNDDGELEGGAGDLESADYTSDLNNEDVGEGDEDVEVAGLDLEADGSDIALTAARISIDQEGVDGADAGSDGPSDDLDDYASSLTLWFDGEELDTVDVDDIDEDDGEYTHTFSFDWEDAIIREGEEGQLTLSINAQDNIDEDDLDENTFEVFFETVRYIDAQDATVTEDSLDDIGEEGDAGQEGREFEFTSFAEANDVELTVDESDDSPEEGSMQVDEDGEEMTILIGELEAEGADLEITEIIAEITSTGSSIDADNDGTIETDEDNTEDVASEYCLVIDGDEVDCVDSDEETTGASTTVATYTFDVEDVVVEKDETLEFEIVAHLNEIEEGEFVILEASVNADDVEAETEEDGEDVEDADKEGSAEGEPQTFRSEGLVVDFDEEASEDETRSDNNVGEFVFVLDISSLGDETNLDESDFDFTVTRDNGIVGSTTIGVNGASADPTVTVSTDLQSNDFDEDNNVFEIDENEGTITFTVFVQIGQSSDAGVYEVTLNDIENEDGTTETSVNEEVSEFIGFES